MQATNVTRHDQRMLDVPLISDDKTHGGARIKPRAVLLFLMGSRIAWIATAVVPLAAQQTLIKKLPKRKDSIL